MTAITAATVAVRTMADGTLRLSVDIEPKDAKDAFNLFGAPGQPVAIAALKEGFAQAGRADEPATQERVGPLCREAVSLCVNAEFQKWLKVSTADEARAYVLSKCAISSRKELDRDAYTGNIFVNEIRQPFLRWQRERKLG